jgi:hypothetical protein
MFIAIENLLGAYAPRNSLDSLAAHQQDHTVLKDTLEAYPFGPFGPARLWLKGDGLGPVERVTASRTLLAQEQTGGNHNGAKDNFAHGEPPRSWCSIVMGLKEPKPLS